MATKTDFDGLHTQIAGELKSVTTELEAAMAKVRGGKMQQAEMDAEFQKLTEVHDTLKAAVDKLAGN